MKSGWRRRGQRRRRRRRRRHRRRKKKKKRAIKRKRKSCALLLSLLLSSIQPHNLTKRTNDARCLRRGRAKVRRAEEKGEKSLFFSNHHRSFLSTSASLFVVAALSPLSPLSLFDACRPSSSFALPRSMLSQKSSTSPLRERLGLLRRYSGEHEGGERAREATERRHCFFDFFSGPSNRLTKRKRKRKKPLTYTGSCSATP